MRNGISGGPLPQGLKYGGPIQQAADDTNWFAPVLYAVAWIETISVETWIEATWPGKTAATVVTGNGGDDPFGYGLLQETPQTSGLALPANWEDPYTAAVFAVRNHLQAAEAFWSGPGYGFTGDALVRCMAAEYNAGRDGALRGHAAGNVGLDTTPGPDGTPYPDRVLAVYHTLIAGNAP